MIYHFGLTQQALIIPYINLFCMVSSQRISKPLITGTLLNLFIDLTFFIKRFWPPFVGKKNHSYLEMQKQVKEGKIKIKIVSGRCVMATIEIEYSCFYIIMNKLHENSHLWHRASDVIQAMYIFLIICYLFIYLFIIQRINISNQFFQPSSI